MKHEYCYFKSHISPEICRKILDDSSSLEIHQATVGDNINKATDETIRKSRTKFIHDTDSRFTHLFDTIWKTAMRANLDFWNFHITKLGYIQLAEYDASYLGEYKVHQDVIWKIDTGLHRKLSCVIQLSDPNDYEGGEFEIVEPGMIALPQEQIKQQGTIIFFPSMFAHRAKPVTKGVRYSIAAWFEGPYWR